MSINYIYSYYQDAVEMRACLMDAIVRIIHAFIIIHYAFMYSCLPYLLSICSCLRMWSRTAAFAACQLCAASYGFRDGECQSRDAVTSAKVSYAVSCYTVTSPFFTIYLFKYELSRAGPL